MPTFFWIPLAIAVAVVAMATSPGHAFGATTRAEYVAQVDQTCSASAPTFKKELNSIVKTGLNVPIPPPNGRHTKSFLRKLKRWNRKLERAERKFIGTFSDMVERIALVPAAPGDEPEVEQWIGGLRQFVQAPPPPIVRCSKGGS